jgi:hypothetical protein
VITIDVRSTQLFSDEARFGVLGRRFTLLHLDADHA